MNDMSDPSAQNQFTLEQIYLKDCSFESPLAPSIFTEELSPPEAGVNIQTQINGLPNRPGSHEVVLAVTIEAKSEDRSLFVCEVQMAALVTLASQAEPEQSRILGARAPEALFPYVRQAIADLVTRGGFLPVMLQPLNFDAIYEQQASQSSTQLNG